VQRLAAAVRERGDERAHRGDAPLGDLGRDRRGRFRGIALSQPLRRALDARAQAQDRRTRQPRARGVVGQLGRPLLA
jgi:hypothetical protein